MGKRFKVGDHVTWNSEAGHVSGTIINVHTKDFDYKGRTHHATRTISPSVRENISAPNLSYAAQYLAYAFPYQRFACSLMITRA